MRISILLALLSLAVKSNSQLPPRLYVDKETRKIGYQDPKTRAVVIEPVYELASPFVETDKWAAKTEYIATVQLSGKVGYINTVGKVVIPINYDSAKSFSAGLAAAKKNGKWGYIDAKGKQVIPFQFESASAFDNISSTKKLAPVKQNGKWGFCDGTGKILIDFQFEDARTFEYDKAAVKKNNKWGYINDAGKLLIPHEYDYAGQFSHNDSAAVGKDDLAFIINSKGEKLEKPTGEWSLAAIGLSRAQDYFKETKEKERKAKLPFQNYFYAGGFGYSSPQKDLDKKAQEVWDSYVKSSKEIAEVYGNFNTAWEKYFANGKDSATLKSDKNKGRTDLYESTRTLAPFFNKHIEQHKTLALNPGENLLADAYGNFLLKQKGFMDEAWNLISYMAIRSGLWKDFNSGMKALELSIEQLKLAQKELHVAAEQSVRRNVIRLK